MVLAFLSGIRQIRVEEAIRARADPCVVASVQRRRRTRNRKPVDGAR